MKNIIIAITEYCSTVFRNIFTVIIMTMMAFLLIISSSLVIREWEKYEPIAEVQGERGIVYYDGMNSVELENATTYESYRAELLDSDEKYIFSCVYSDWVIDNWSPRLKKGSWIKADSEELEIVVGGSIKAKVGDRLELYAIGEDGNELVKAKVVGVLADMTKLFNGTDSYSSSVKNYEMFYGTSSEKMIVIMSQKSADKYGIYYSPASFKIAILDDSISDDEYEKIYRDVELSTSFSAQRWSEFKENSNDKIKVQLITYIPIVLIGMFLIITGMFISAYINMRTKLRHQVIFYLLGAKPSSRFGIAFSEIIINTIFSVLLFAIASLLITNSGYRGDMVIYYSAKTYIVLGIYYLVNILLCFCFYMSIWNKLSPKEALIKERVI